MVVSNEAVMHQKFKRQDEIEFPHRCSLRGKRKGTDSEPRNVRESRLWFGVVSDNHSIERNLKFNVYDNIFCYRNKNRETAGAKKP